MIVKKFYLEENDVHATLTTYILDDSPELLNGRNRPAIIICPGGGYFNCSDREAEPMAVKFNSMGYHAFVLRYNIYLEPEDEYELIHKVDPLPIKKRTQFPRQMYDIAKSIVLINEHAEEWFVDTDKIGLCGFSAGGHNVLSYSVNWNRPIIQDVFSKFNVNLKPALTIAGYPISDYTLMEAALKKAPTERQKFFNKSSRVLFGADWPNEEQLLIVSPAKLVDQDTPPMFLWSTFEDGAVPIEQTTVMATALATNKIPFACHIFEEGVHGLSVSTQVSADAHSKINYKVSKWMELVEEWLLKRFELDLPEKSKYE